MKFLWKYLKKFFLKVFLVLNFFCQFVKLFKNTMIKTFFKKPFKFKNPSLNLQMAPHRKPKFLHDQTMFVLLEILYRFHARLLLPHMLVPSKKRKKKSVSLELEWCFLLLSFMKNPSSFRHFCIIPQTGIFSLKCTKTIISPDLSRNLNQHYELKIVQFFIDLPKEDKSFVDPTRANFSITQKMRSLFRLTHKSCRFSLHGSTTSNLLIDDKQFSFFWRTDRTAPIINAAQC